MDSGFYAACTGLRARVESLDLVAHNLANINTTGYRGQQPTFRSVLALAADQGGAELNRAMNNFGVLESSRTDLSSGNLERTGNQLDLAIEGKAFFAVQTDAGIFYTRNGNFQVSGKGQLITAQQDLVLGEQGPIQVPGGAVSIGPDGTLSAGGAVAGRLRLVEFKQPSSLMPVGASYYAAEGTTSIAKDSYVRQGMLETSNVNPVTATVSLIALQRHAEMLQRALSTFHTEFNRIAAGDLPRV
jgi:flagellar basal-body rod protein FlgF